MEQKTIKSFWERPEGTTGMIVGVLVLFALGYIGWSLLPIIITLLQNTIYAAVLAAIAAALLYVLFFDNRLRTAGLYTYKSLMRWFTSMIIEIDPIGILRNYIETLKKNLSQMDVQIQNLSGQMRKLGEQIKNNETEKNNYLKIANQAQKQDNKPAYILNTRAAGRLDESNKTLKALYTRMEGFHNILHRMYDACNIMIQDMENDMQVKAREREAIKASYSTLKNAMRIIKGDKDGRDLYDQTMEYLQDDYGQKLGEIEHFMSISASFMDKIDLQNGAFDEDAVKMLEEWEQQSTISLPTVTYDLEPEQITR